MNQNRLSARRAWVPLTAVHRPAALRSVIASLACALVTLLVCPCGPTAPRPALGATPPLETLIEALFGDTPNTDGLDLNSDGALTVADIVADILVPGPLFPGTVAEFVPHAMGDQLVYRVTDPTGKVTTETTIVISATAEGAFVLDDQQVNGPQVVKHEMQSYVDMGSQLFFSGGTDVLRGLNTTCSPSLLRLTTPVVAQQTISTTTVCTVRTVSHDLFVGTINRVDTYTPIELVDSLTLRAGTFAHVVHFSGSTNLSGDLETDEIYIAPGVGAILQLSTAGGQTTRHELISGTIGGHPVGQ